MQHSGPGYPPQGAPPPGPPLPGSPAGYAPAGAPDGRFQPPPVGAYPGYHAPSPATTEAVLALVLAIVGFTTSCFPLSVVAVYFGVKARRQAREAGEPNSTNGALGLVGIILGAIFGAIWGALWLLYGVMILAYVGVVVAGVVGVAATGP